VIELRRAGLRFHTRQSGIETWHSFSAGAHYDSDNVGVGPLIGVDEHRLDPGAGFGWHRHRGVRIVSYVLSGTLRHEDSAGRCEIGPGQVLCQMADAGIEHAEGNASSTEELCFVQMTVLATGTADFDVVAAPGRLESPGGYAFVADGTVRIGAVMLQPGDAAVVRDESVELYGVGTALVWRLGFGVGTDS
jgi:uncharacterized RmlC-like cupin family protein